MKLLRSMLLSVLMSFAYVVPAVWAAEPPASPQPQQASLYQRLGGYDALAAVSDDFLGHLANDPQMGRFFVGLSTDSRNKVRQHVVDFLCVATGGPCKYTGRDMKTAHTGLNITDSDWTSMVKYLVGTLDKFKVPEKEKNEVLTALSALKGDMVGR
jgi:hemoglobin